MTTVIAMLALSLGYAAVAPGHWLRALGAMSATMFVAAVLRAVITPRRVGLLAVRGRWLDVACYTGLGVLILTTGLLVPSSSA